MVVRTPADAMQQRNVVTANATVSVDAAKEDFGTAAGGTRGEIPLAFQANSTRTGFYYLPEGGVLAARWDTDVELLQHTLGNAFCLVLHCRLSEHSNACVGASTRVWRCWLGYDLLFPG